GHLIRPPVKIGHEEKQPTLQAGEGESLSAGTGVPKFGTVDWTTARKVKGACPACWGTGYSEQERCPACKGTGHQIGIRASLKDVPPSIAKLVSNKAYDRVSAEVYDEPPPGVPGKGKTLRAVSLLGGQLPEIKTLEDVLHVHTESQPWRATRMSEGE